MMMAASTFMSFPPIAWWQALSGSDKIWIDGAVPFRKMGWNNRYRIATANGPLLLSIPVIGGRNQRLPLKDVLIESKTDWQKQHWRSIFSAYGRAPFFEHYGPEIELLLTTKFERLADFNLATLNWSIRSLRLDLTLTVEDVAESPVVEHDLRLLPFQEQQKVVKYAQVFEDRNGFIPNLSILDLLMNEGPAAITFIK